VSQIKYRSDIDGLRAVAVLGVVIYHAFPWLIPGGFIGVDIFFVISGYLISGILYKGHLQGNFSFREFYARRVRRLFPALITVLVATMAYGWLILLPDEFQQLGKHVAAGTLFIQNIVFWQESGYFDTAANLKPLLHLWSLAVEEQFYIFFPPILLLIWKRKWPLAAVMGVLLLASMIGNLVMSYQNSASDFFLTPYRAWEFLGGSLLAWWHYDRGHEEDVPHYREALSIGGGILLALGMGLIHKETPYPGWRALLPVAGTLMLMEGGRGAWVNKKILSNPAVVWIGLISYPLYLFHWPALSFVHIVKGESPKPGYIVAALGMSFLLTIPTYYFIEKKLRHYKSRWILPALAGAFVAAGIGGLLASYKIIIPWMEPKILKIHNSFTDKEVLMGLKKPITEFTNTIGGDGPQTLFFGDSNLIQYAPRIVNLLKNNKGNERGAILIWSGGIPPIPGYLVKTKPECAKYFEIYNKTTTNDKRIDRVVISALWGIYLMRGSGNTILGLQTDDHGALTKLSEALGEMIKKLTDKDIKVYVVLGANGEKLLDPKNIIKRGFLGSHLISPPIISSKEYLQNNHDLIAMITKTAQKNGAKIIDPLDYLCSGGAWKFSDEEGVPIRIDVGHLRPGYVREHVKYLDETVAP
jgi:peptidoglycan/LPS O-acetylase OafA/YrhL